MGHLFLVLVRRPGGTDQDYREAYATFKGVGVPNPRVPSPGYHGPRAERGWIRVEGLDLTLSFPVKELKDEEHALTLTQAGVTAAAYAVPQAVHASAQEGRTVGGTELTTLQIAAITQASDAIAWADHYAQRTDPRPGQQGSRGILGLSLIHI